MRGISHNFRRPAPLFVDPWNLTKRCGPNHSLRPKTVERDTRILPFSSQTEAEHAHRKLGKRVSGMLRNQPGTQRESNEVGGANVKTCGFSRPIKCGRQSFEQRNVPRALICSMRSNRLRSVASARVN